MDYDNDMTSIYVITDMELRSLDFVLALAGAFVSRHSIA